MNKSVSKDIPGRIGLRLGLTSGMLAALSAERVVRPDSAKVADLLDALALLLPSFFLGAACSCAPPGGARAGLIPILLRFIMLAGVTGVIAVTAVALDGTLMTGPPTAEVRSETGWDGLAGGGIGGSSIGDGESPGKSWMSETSIPTDGRATPLNSGVELAERDTRNEVRFGWVLVPSAGRIEGWRLRRGLVTAVSSSPLEVAPLRFRLAALPPWLCVSCALELLKGPSQGLVNGEMSLKSEEPDGIESGGLMSKAMCAGAECGADGIIWWDCAMKLG